MNKRIFDTSAQPMTWPALALCCAAMAVSLPAPAPAADEPAATELTEIVVTARFAKENVQDTPIAITAIDAQALEQRGANDVLDVAAMAPNVSIFGGGSINGKSASTFIRGIGQPNYNLAFEPAVGYYVDDVYQGTVFGSIFELDDIDSVDILRGPQGTLFGKSNEGGAILLHTVKPTGEGNGYVEAGYGNYSHERIRAAYDMTLVPSQVFLRVAVASDEADGWLTRYDYACLNPGSSGKLTPFTNAPGCVLGTEGGQNTQTARATLRYVPSDDLEVLVRADVYNDRGQASPTKLLAVNNAPGTGLNNYNNNVAIPLFGIPFDSRFITSSPYSNYATYQDPSTGRTFPDEDTVYAYGTSAEVNWNAPGDLHVRNVLAYRHSEESFANDQGDAPIPTVFVLQTPSHEQYSEELTVSGRTLKDMLEWTAGAFYYNALSYSAGQVLLPALQIVAPLGPTSPFAPNGIYGLDFINNDPVYDRDTSIFAHSVFHATSQWSVEAGIRYTEQLKTYTFYRTALSTNPPNPLFPVGPIKGLYGTGARAETDRIDPKIAVQYSWTPQLMTYVQVATGYKGAGVNSQPVVAADVKPFGAESLISYEMGAKSEWFDRRFRLNGAIFHSDYKDLQQNYYAPDGTNTTVNTGRVDVDGAELEFNGVLAQGLLANANVSYLRWNTLELGLAADVPADLAPTLHTAPPYVPKWKFNTGLQYAFAVGAAGKVTPRLDWNYQTEVFNDLANTPAARQPGYGLLNGRISFEPSNSKWVVAFEARNLLQKVYYTVIYNDLPSYGPLEGSLGPPRMILGTVKYSF